MEGKYESGKNLASPAATQQKTDITLARPSRNQKETEQKRKFYHEGHEEHEGGKHFLGSMPSLYLIFVSFVTFVVSENLWPICLCDTAQVSVEDHAQPLLREESEWMLRRAEV